MNDTVLVHFEIARNAPLAEVLRLAVAAQDMRVVLGVELGELDEDRPTLPAPPATSAQRPPVDREADTERPGSAA